MRKPPWISTQVRLPVVNKLVLCAAKNKATSKLTAFCGYINAEGFWCLPTESDKVLYKPISNYIITHWCYIPDFPSTLLR